MIANIMVHTYPLLYCFHLIYYQKLIISRLSNSANFTIRQIKQPQTEGYFLLGTPGTYLCPLDIQYTHSYLGTKGQSSLGWMLNLWTSQRCFLIVSVDLNKSQQQTLQMEIVSNEYPSMQEEMFFSSSFSIPGMSSEGN